MIKRLFPAVFVMLSLLPAQAITAEKDLVTSSETVRTRLEKKEIIDLMTKSAKIPAEKQDERLSRILKNQSESKTPRSDFLFCAGLAYMGNPKAQECLGKAYETGLGIVQDLSNAFLWYSLALETRSSDKGLQAGRRRVQIGLQIVYPSPTDEELDEMVQAEKSRIEEYRAIVKNAGN